MPGVPEVERTQVLAYRIAAQHLDRVDHRPAELAVLELGVQDTPYGSARLALAARTTAPLDDESVALVWSTRGAPHLHRRSDLCRLAAALWPLSDPDAGRRIASSQVKGAAGLGLRAFEETAAAFRTVVRHPMPKGEVSTKVSALVPVEASYPCRSCRATHISGALFQQAGLAGGVQLRVIGAKTVLLPIDGWPGVPSAARGTDAVVRTYLRLLGPATPTEAAKFVGINQTELRQVWPADLAEVRLDGRRTWLPAERVDALRAAPRPRLVRLLPPSDPYLQARDRNLIVPDKRRQSEVWRILGNPGALLVDGEIVGVWRAKLAGKARLDLSVTPFGPLTARVRAALDSEARVLAGARGATEARVTVAG